MIYIEETDQGLRVMDSFKNEVDITIDDWEEGGRELPIDRDVELVVTGTASEIRLNMAALLVESDQLDSRQLVLINEQLEIPEGKHLLQTSAKIPTYIRSDSEVKIIAGSLSEGMRICFPAGKPISFGFRTIDKASRELISVPPTTEGFSSVLSHFGSLHKVESPDRSFPSMRPDLPRIALDSNLGRAGTLSNPGDNPIQFSIPDSLEYLFPIAPLSYYVGAEISLVDQSIPSLETEEKTLEFSTQPEFNSEVSNLLYRIFYLDCLVREVGDNAVGLREFDLLTQFQLDFEDVFHMPIEERIFEYLNLPFDSITTHLPDWPLAMHIDPTNENILLLPYVLERLSLVFTPVPVRVSKQGIIERSLDRTYRTSSAENSKSTPCFKVNQSEVPIAVNGWVADGSPLNAFKCPTVAIENSHSFAEHSSMPIKVAIILNEPSMEPEFLKVIQTYRDRAKSLSISVNIFESLDYAEMIELFQSPYDFVHYIGHCNQAGLRCSDGFVSAESVQGSRVRTFFLNACGSVKEGLKLIKSGSVVGGVTTADVIDDQAMKVGHNFAKFVINGFSFERALYYSRNSSIMNQNYAIVGDGTFSLSQGNTTLPSVIDASRTSENQYHIRLLAIPFKLNGGFHQTWVDKTPSLMGNHDGILISETEFNDLLNAVDSPILFENGIFWPEEFLEEKI